MIINMVVNIDASTIEQQIAFTCNYANHCLWLSHCLLRRSPITWSSFWRTQWCWIWNNCINIIGQINMNRLCMMNVPEVEQLDGVWVPDGCVGGLTVAVILTEWAQEQHNLSKNWERTFKKKLPAFYGRKKPNAVVQIYAHLWGELVCCNISLLCHNCSFSLGGVAHRQHNKMLTCSVPQLHKPQRNGSFDLKCILNQVFSWLAGQVQTNSFWWH